MQDNYYEIISRYQKINLWTIYKKFSNILFDFSISSIFIILGILLYFLGYKLLLDYYEFLFILLIFIKIISIDNKTVKYFQLKNSYFFKYEKMYWRSTRALMFLEELVANNLIIGNPREFIKRIKEENELKKLNILQQPIVTLVLALFVAVCNALFDKIGVVLQIKIFIFLFVFLAGIFYYFGIFRSEASKANDLVLFLIWYENANSILL